MEIIWDKCFTDNEIRTALEQLPKGLDKTYQLYIKRIKDSGDSRSLRALKWISYATRPFHIKELREAIAFNLHDTIWNSSNIPPRNFIVGCYNNLIVLDSNNDCIYFAHPSVKQYLEKHIVSRTSRYSSCPL